MHFFKKNKTYANLNKIKYLNLFLLIFFLCAFELQDVVFKNLDLLPDTNDKTNRVPNFIPKEVKDTKPEKLFDKPKMPDIKVEEKPADSVVKVKGFFKEYTQIYALR